jgi:hypothetical protein
MCRVFFQYHPIYLIDMYLGSNSPPPPQLSIFFLSPPREITKTLPLKQPCPLFSTPFRIYKLFLALFFLNLFSPFSFSGGWGGCKLRLNCVAEYTDWCCVQTRRFLWRTAASSPRTATPASRWSSPQAGRDTNIRIPFSWYYTPVL